MSPASPAPFVEVTEGGLLMSSVATPSRNYVEDRSYGTGKKAKGKAKARQHTSKYPQKKK